MEMTSYQDGAVYSLGYLTVKKYLGKSGKTIKEAFADKYADIENCTIKKPGITLGLFC